MRKSLSLLLSIALLMFSVSLPPALAGAESTPEPTLSEAPLTEPAQADPTQEPTETPSAEPALTAPSPEPTETPSAEPAQTNPTLEPSETPSAEPALTDPTQEPSETPSVEPAQTDPSPEPSETPLAEPAQTDPTQEPSEMPLAHLAGVARAMAANVAPSNITISNAVFDENLPVGTVIGILSATDPDVGDTITFTFAQNESYPNNAYLTIDGNALTVNTVFDYESKPSFFICVRATDASGLTCDQVINLAVTNVNEAPWNITLSNASIAENAAIGTVVGTLSATDDAGDTDTFTFCDNGNYPDNACFTIVDNKLQVNSSVDYEAKSIYSISVQAADQAGWGTAKVFTVTVTNVNEAPSDIALSSTTIAENAAIGTVVGTLSATDDDVGDPIRFAFVDDAHFPDNGSFTIVGNELRVNSSFDYEAQSSFSIRVSAIDQGEWGTAKSFTVTVANANEAPNNIALSNVLVAENAAIGTPVGTFSVSDPDAYDMITFTLYDDAGYPDNGSFTIVDDELKANASFDFEAKSSYFICVRATDLGGLTFEKTFTVTVTNVNEAPSNLALSNATIPENSSIGTVVGTLSATDDAGDTDTFTLYDDANYPDNRYFTIDGNALKANGNFDYEAKSSYSIRVQATDPGEWGTAKEFTVTVTNVNEAPRDITLSNVTFAENSPTGTVVGTLSATDPDVGNTHTFTLVNTESYPNNAYFTIAGNELKVNSSFNYEAKSSFSIHVCVTDQDGLTYEKSFGVTVTNANEAPWDLALSNNTIAENSPTGTVIGTLSAMDEDASDTHTFTLVNNASYPNNAYFTIVGNELRVNSSFNYEVKSSFSIRVCATDQGGLTKEKSFGVTVTNGNDAPWDLALSNNTIAENSPTGTVIGTLSAMDEDAGDTHTFALVNDAQYPNNRYFTIDGSQLKANASFDYEVKSSFSIRVCATDAGGLTHERSFGVTVTNVNDAPGDIALSSSTFPENSAIGTVIGTFSAMDEDAGDTHTFTLVNDTQYPDNRYFTIDGSQLKANASFDYEVKSSFSIRVCATDQGGLTHERPFGITVTNVNDAPGDIALSSSMFPENSAIGTVIGTLSATDPDAGETHTFALVNNANYPDNAYFTIDGSQLKANASFDYEVKSSFSIRVCATDQGGLTREKSFAVTVTDVNEAPSDIALSNATIAENAPTGTVVGTLSATGMSDSHTFALVDDANYPDNAYFTIDGSTLKANASFDYEAQSLYRIRVRATASADEPIEKEFTVSVTDLNEAPTAISLSKAKVSEGKDAGAAIGVLSAADPDAGDAVTFALVSGKKDNAAFSISGNRLLTAEKFDYEAKHSYTVLVRAADGEGLTFDQTFVIEITDVDESDDEPADEPTDEPDDEPVYYPLTVPAVEGCSIVSAAVSSGSGEVAQGGQAALAFNTDEGYKLTGVLIDGILYPAARSLMIDNADAEHTIELVCEPLAEGETAPLPPQMILDDTSGVVLAAESFPDGETLSWEQVVSASDAFDAAYEQGTALYVGVPTLAELAEEAEGPYTLIFPVDAAYEGQTLTFLVDAPDGVRTEDVLVENGLAVVTLDELGPVALTAR